MNMKNTVILLIFLLSILGLILGVHYTENITNDDTQDNDLNSIDLDNDSDLTIAMEKNEDTGLDQFFT